MKEENIKEDRIISETEETQALEQNESKVKADGAKGSFIGVIFANVLDQLLVAAGSALLVYLFDLVLKLFGYMFVRDNGALILAGAIIYFIINCIYVPITEKSKLKSTIARKILNIN